jgi:hypothetical protein
VSGSFSNRYVRRNVPVWTEEFFRGSSAADLDSFESLHGEIDFTLERGRKKAIWTTTACCVCVGLGYGFAFSDAATVSLM